MEGIFFKNFGTRVAAKILMKQPSRITSNGEYTLHGATAISIYEIDGKHGKFLSADIYGKKEVFNVSNEIFIKTVARMLAVTAEPIDLTFRKEDGKITIIYE